MYACLNHINYGNLHIIWKVLSRSTFYCLLIMSINYKYVTILELNKKKRLLHNMNSIPLAAGEMTNFYSFFIQASWDWDYTACLHNINVVCIRYLVSGALCKLLTHIAIIFCARQMVTFFLIFFSECTLRITLTSATLQYISTVE